jgi:hypothetical protein
MQVEIPRNTNIKSVSGTVNIEDTSEYKQLRENLDRCNKLGLEIQARETQRKIQLLKDSSVGKDFISLPVPVSPEDMEVFKKLLPDCYGTDYVFPNYREFREGRDIEKYFFGEVAPEILEIWDDCKNKEMFDYYIIRATYSNAACKEYALFGNKNEKYYLIGRWGDKITPIEEIGKTEEVNKKRSARIGSALFILTVIGLILLFTLSKSMK